MSDLSDRIQETIDAEPVVAFIKGTHEQCMCGNSERALHALRSVGTSFTAVDVNGTTLTLRQISETGTEVDRIVITKPSRLGGQERPDQHRP